MTYLVIGFLAICLTPMLRNWWLLLIYLIPIVAVLYVARTGTDADSTGITVRTLFGSERLSWSQIDGLRIGRRGELFAVQGTQQLRLPTARWNDVDRLNSISESAQAPS
jgi:hypothetical protein